MAECRRKRFSALGFSYTTNISYNVTYSLIKIEFFLSEEDEAQECGVSGGMTAFSDVTEGKERQKPASRMAKKKRSIRSFFVRLGLIVRRIFRVGNGDRFYEGCKSVKVSWSYSWSVTEIYFITI
ncbi:hypothetical protein YC2023_033436 [Brassica napus]